MAAIRKILIGNRGEIAIRIMKSCRSLGISTVAIFSEADAGSPHLDFADEAVCVGPPPSKDSYLHSERILEWAKKVAADAIHPGYGFLSENASFAEKCELAKVVFIGPTAESIRKMGDKAVSKKIAADVKVPTIPGFFEKDASVEALMKKADMVGYPLLIKAVAGGGGKGMRVVQKSGDLKANLEAAQREAQKSFGDGSLLMERYLTNCRHIEVQIVGDSFGNHLHLFERECSLQRRYQKILEESPAPNLNDSTRKGICEAAVRMAQAVNYRGAGTVEFVLAPSGEFFFLEMNTRLQVEHRVTELVTGLDLVELQIRIAEGEKLPMTQDSVHAHGHAVETRLYAEDPTNQFLPASGRLSEWRVPELFQGMLVDAGVKKDQQISIFYDPLLAKLVAHGKSRREALRKMEWLLDHTVCLGMTTNQEFLKSLLQDEKVQSGNVHTRYVEDNLPGLLPKKTEEASLLSIAACALFHFFKEPTVGPAGVIKSFRNNPFRDPEVSLLMGDKEYKVIMGSSEIHLNDKKWSYRAEDSGCDFCVTFDSVRYRFCIVYSHDVYQVQSRLGHFELKLCPRFPETSREKLGGGLRAPMTGKIMRVVVSPGQKVQDGDPLVIMEAMKMEQTIHAQSAGTIKEVLVREGEMVQSGAQVVELA